MKNYNIAVNEAGTYTMIPNINRALRDLTSGEFKVYAAIANYCRDKKNPYLAYASQEFLAECVGRTRQQTNHNIKGLVAKGYIASTPRLEFGVKRGNNYQILQVEEPIKAPVAKDNHY